MAVIQPLSKRIQKIEVSAIKQMALKAQQYSDIISFGWGVPSSPSPEPIREAVCKALQEDPHVDQYAPVPGILPLREKIAETWPGRYGYSIFPSHVLVTAGAMEALMCLMHTLFDPGDEVIVMDPGFSSHIEQMELSGVVPRFVPLSEDREWGFDREALSRALSEKTRAIILINPNNPTGNIFSKSDIEFISSVVQDKNLWLLIDEPYTYLVYDNETLYHPLFIPEVRKHVIVIQSFSKKYSMTGWRMGYIVAPDAEIILEVMKVHDATIVSAPRISQIAALAALSIPDDIVEEERARMQECRDVICAWMDTVPDLFSYVRPKGAYYIFPRIVAGQFKDDVAFAHTLLDEARVVVTPGYAFGPTGKAHVRLCFSGHKDTVQKGAERISAWWEKKKKEI